MQGNIYLGNLSDLELDTFPPTRWGNGYKGTAATQFPHPNMYSLQNSRIPLDQLTVRHLTRILSARKRKHPPAKMAWQARLNIKDHVWEDAASRCTTTFLTPRDVHTHYKHIIHRALTTRERGLTPQCGTLCRMCGLRKENSLHMGECNVIRKLFMRINSLKALEVRRPLRIPPHPRRTQASSHPHPLRHSGRGAERAAARPKRDRTQ